MAHHPLRCPVSLAKGVAYIDLTQVDWVDIGIAFHIVRHSDGTGGLNFDANDCHFTQISAVRCGVSFDKDALEQINAHNFMSYAPDDCREVFTNEQLRKIRTTLEDKRTELLKNG